MSNCETCAEKKKQAEPVPYTAHETDMARMERANHRQWVVIIILILALLATNAGWIAYESQFETVTVTQEVEQDAENGVNHFVGGDFYGETESSNNDNPEGP